MRSLLLVVLAVAASAHADERAPPKPPRFAIAARVEPAAPAAADRRFALKASATLADESRSRFTVKALSADCGTVVDGVFADGFE